MSICPEYLLSNSAPQLVKLSDIIDVLYISPTVPVIYATEYLLCGSYSRFLYLASIRE
jgi:hypothetical protein